MRDRKIGKFTQTMDKLVNIVGGSMFFLMVMFTSFNVISFWTTGRRYGQLEELVISCLVWASFICLGQHYREHKCICADFLITALPDKKKIIIEFITDILTLVIAVVVFYYGIQLMLRSTDKYTAVMKVCYVWIDLGIVIGFLSLIYNIIIKYIPHKKIDAEKEDSVV